MCVLFLFIILILILRRDYYLVVYIGLRALHIIAHRERVSINMTAARLVDLRQ